jgi:hypothetical protein
VVGAKKLAPTLARSKVKRGKRQTVTVRGLAAYEPVTIRYQGTVIRRTADRHGATTATFRVGRATGRKRITITGLGAPRAGAATFRIVR